MKIVGGSEGSARESTRDRVTCLLLEHGPATAATLGERLGLSPAGVRRHLDALLAEGEVEQREISTIGRRGRGRPAKVFALTETGRARFPHAYDDLAVAAMRFLERTGGHQAVTAFAEARVAVLEERHSSEVGAAGEPEDRLRVLADALSREGYAAATQPMGTGGQLCQHHCPVAHVAAEFPQLCETETKAFARMLGTHVQRLATIARGDGVCTTHVPAAGDARGTSVIPRTGRKKSV